MTELRGVAAGPAEQRARWPRPTRDRTIRNRSDREFLRFWVIGGSGSGFAEDAPQLARGLSVASGSGIALGTTGLILSGVGVGQLVADNGFEDVFEGALMYTAGTGMTLIGGVVAGSGSLGQALRLRASPVALGVGLAGGVAALVVATTADPDLGVVVGVPLVGAGLVVGSVAQGLVNREHVEVAILPSPMRGGARVTWAGRF